MNRQDRFGPLAVIGSMLLLTACGGGGGANGSPASNSTAQPPSSAPTPPTLTPVVIFPNPSPQTYALVGSSTQSASAGYNPVAPDARLTNISLEAADQPRLLYGPGGYQIQLPGRDFDQLVHYKGLLNPTTENNFFQPARASQNAATFIIRRSSLDGYIYSELAGWTNAIAPDSSGHVAFGIPTPVATLATFGRASYRGPATGIVDITYFDGLYGGHFFSDVEGTVTLTVDFATRAIEGTLEIDDADGTFHISVPLTATAFDPGEDCFLGSFGTSQSGFNEFRVKLTGPAASELVGSWAVPTLIDGEPHQLMGAWIATR